MDDVMPNHEPPAVWMTRMMSARHLLKTRLLSMKSRPCFYGLHRRVRA